MLSSVSYSVNDLTVRITEDEVTVTRPAPPIDPHSRYQYPHHFQPHLQFTPEEAIEILKVVEDGLILLKAAA